MKLKLVRSVTGLFCEDLREEKTGLVTIIGVLPDNIAAPTLPGIMPKLAVYLRGYFPVSKPPNSFGFRVEYPWDSPPFEYGGSSPEDIQKEVAAAKEQANEGLVLTIRGMFSPFGVQAAGRVRLIAVVDGQPLKVGSLNFIRTPQPSPTPAPSTGEQVAVPRPKRVRTGTKRERETT